MDNQTAPAAPVYTKKIKLITEEYDNVLTTEITYQNPIPPVLMYKGECFTLTHSENDVRIYKRCKMLELEDAKP